MSWIFIALIAPLLYACTNYIDKVLLDKYFKHSGAGTIILFSSLLSIIALPFLYFFDPTVLDIGFKSFLILMSVGILNVGVLWCYLLALKEEETSIVIVFYQLLPVFGYILGYFILGETLTALQIAAMATIIIGTTIISIEIDVENNYKLRKKTIIPMLVATLLWAISAVIFKYAALEETVASSLFWEHLAMLFIGVIIFTISKPYRRSFVDALRFNTKGVLALNVLNEILYISANVIFSFSFMLAPISLVLLTDSFQAIFAMIIGIVLTIFFPKIVTEKIHKKHVWQKIIALIITGVGTYLLSI